MEQILKNYKNILAGDKLPKFQIAKKKSLLNQKTKEAFSILKSCELCERKCKINRLKGEKGWCQAGREMLISSYFDHYGEEFFLVPSFTIFFWSCTFSCVYCQNWTMSQRFEKPTIISEKELAKIIDAHSHCKNVNFVGGDPTPQLPFILKTLKDVKSNIPVVWNSNFYMSEKSMAILKDLVDIYLSDFKYGNDKCAERLSGIKNYTRIIKRNHLLAAKDAELVIRHLVLPSHIECCSKPILKWISQNLKDKAIVNIMDQYRPEYKAFQYPKKYPEINHPLNSSEFNEVVDYAKKLELNFIT
jgi:putative pyruvate formate lyase activating enzyme